MLSSTSIAVASSAFALLAFASAAQAQVGRLPYPRPASSAESGRPCVPDPMKRYEAANADQARLFEPTGNADRDFANMMSAHHQEGIDMANLEIANGKSSKLKAMARRIVKDQQQEIRELDKWSARHNWNISRRQEP